MAEMTEILVHLLYWIVVFWLCGLVATCLFKLFPSISEGLKRHFFGNRKEE